MTSTVPLPAGDVAVIEVEVFEVMTATAPPKSTLIAPPRLVPLMVTLVPPAVGPEAGTTPLTVGAGTYV